MLSCWSLFILTSGAGSGGKIIGAASMVAHKGVPLMAGYSTSKWGVRGLTVSSNILPE